MKILLCVTLLALSGCATQPNYQWQHPHNNQARFDQDKARCEYEAAVAVGSYTPDTSGYRTVLVAALSEQMDINRRSGEIAVLCMKARGYTQQAIR